MRRWFVIILAAPAVLWLVYWGAAGLAVKQGVENLLQEQSFGDLSSRFGETQLQGFPTSFELSVSDVEVRDAALFSWAVPLVQMSAPSYRPQTVSLDISGRQTIRSRLGALDIEAESFNIGLFFRPELSLPLGRALVTLEAAQLRHETGWRLNADRLLVMLRDITAEVGGAGSLEKTVQDYSLELDARGLDLSALLPELPPAYDEITVATADTILGFSRAWNREVFEHGSPDLRRLLVRRAEITFGNSTIILAGQLDAAQDGVMSGQVVANVEGWHDLLTMLRETGYLDPDLAGLILEVLSDQLDPAETLEIPLKVEDGMVSFGIFSLGLLPPLP